MDIKPGQNTKVLRLLQILLCYLAHTSLLLICAVYVAHCPYVSMGIAALWVNYQQLNNLKISVDDDNCNAHILISVLSRVRSNSGCILDMTSIRFNDKI